MVGTVITACPVPVKVWITISDDDYYTTTQTSDMYYEVDYYNDDLKSDLPDKEIVYTLPKPNYPKLIYAKPCRINVPMIKNYSRRRM
jgi:hypothetical protein